MTNKPTLTAGPLEATPAASAIYLWQVPGKSIQLSLDVVDRLERDAIESFRAVTKRGSEIGGLLLGRRLPSPDGAVAVDDYELVTCDYERGPLYLLSGAEKTRMAEAIQRRENTPEKGSGVVGFFRSNTRRDIALDEEDLAVIHEFFARPDQVFLLVKPFAMKPSAAGFFFWEDGHIKSESSYAPFPFRRSELLKGEFAKSVIHPGGKPADEDSSAPARDETRQPLPSAAFRREGPVPVPPLAKREAPDPTIAVPRSPQPPRQEARATVVPITRQEARVPEPPPATAPAKEEVAPPLATQAPAREEPLRAAPPERKEARIPASPKPAARPLVQPAPKREEPAQAPPPAASQEAKPHSQPVTVVKQEPKEAVGVPAEAAPAVPKAPEKAPPAPATREPISAPAQEMFLQPPPPSFFARLAGIRAIWVLLLVAVLGGAGLFYFLRPKPAGPPAQADPNASSLALRVERNAGQILLSWNREAPLIQSAQRAILSISDGDHKEDVELDLGQLRSGSVVYSPITNDVSFRLEVANLKEGKSQSESVRVLAGRPSPAVPVAQQAAPPAAGTLAQHGTPVTQSAKPSDTPATEPAKTAEAEPAGTTPGALPPRIATPLTLPPRGYESLAARISQPVNLPEPPHLENQGAQIASRPLVSQPNVSAPPPPVREAPKPAPQQTAAAAEPPASRPAPTQTAPAEQRPSSQPAAAPRIGGAVRDAVLIRRVTPVYPPLARQARISGVVRVEATIGKDGKVTAVRVLNGPPLLRPAAVDAVRQFLYSPSTLNGEPVEAHTQIDVSFSLNR